MRVIINAVCGGAIGYNLEAGAGAIVGIVALVLLVINSVEIGRNG